MAKPKYLVMVSDGRVATLHGPFLDGEAAARTADRWNRELLRAHGKAPGAPHAAVRPLHPATADARKTFWGRTDG